MALVKCPDCGKEISDGALSCIGCGRPMQIVRKPLEPPSSTTKEKQSLASQSTVQEGKPQSESEWDRHRTIRKQRRNSTPKAFSWNSFLIALLITFVITVIAAAATGEKLKGFHWTLAWIFLTVEGWKYWRWKSLIPYPAFLLCVSLASAVVGVAGGDILDVVIVKTAINVVGVTIFAVIYYHRFKRERINSGQQGAAPDLR